MRLYRHGDLLIREIKSIPAQIERINSNVLAEGEATGHRHELHGLSLIYQAPDHKFIDAKETIQLTHQEHKTIQIEPGFYEVRQEREYDPFFDLKMKWIDDKRMAEERARYVSD